jgi:putative chitinase
MLAYSLGTLYHETAHTMQPIIERGQRAYFDKYEPGTRIGKILGNTQPGGGYRYRGEGHVQNTGRANAAKATKRLNQVFNLGIDLVANPEKRGDPFISAHSLFLGNKEGWWTGKGLLAYLDGVDEADAEDLREFVNARRVVNGTDKAALIAGYALAFERALKAAGYKPRATSVPQPIEPNPLAPTTKPAGRAPGWVIALIFIAAAAGIGFAIITGAFK